MNLPKLCDDVLSECIAGTILFIIIKKGIKPMKKIINFLKLVFTRAKNVPIIEIETISLACKEFDENKDGKLSYNEGKKVLKKILLQFINKN